MDLVERIEMDVPNGMLGTMVSDDACPPAFHPSSYISKLARFFPSSYFSHLQPFPVRHPTAHPGQTNSSCRQLPPEGLERRAESV